MTDYDIVILLITIGVFVSFAVVGSFIGIGIYYIIDAVVMFRHRRSIKKERGW